MKKIVSLYSGCGGMDLGFIQAGFEVIWAIDNDKSACDTYRFNLGEKIQNKNIHNINFNDIPDMDILIAGPPCQGFSTVGKMHPDDKRNNLLELIPSIIEIKKPNIIFIENVRGLTAVKGGNTLNDFIANLIRLGYRVEYEIINSCDVGIPQNRQRIIIFANKIGLVNFFDTFIKNYKLDKKTLHGVIGDIENIGTLSNHYYSKKFSEEYVSIMKKISEGQKLCNTRLGKSSIHTWDIPEVYGETTDREKYILLLIAKNRRLKRFRKKESWQDASPLSLNEIREIAGGKVSTEEIRKLVEKNYLVEKFEGLFDIKNTFNGKFRRPRYDKPSEAILTNYSSPRNYIHPKKNRPFTVRECARIQSFPDNFLFKGTINDQYRMIGNAVPPVLARFLALHLKEMLFDTKNSNYNKITNCEEFDPYVITQISLKLKKYGSSRLGNKFDPIDELIYLIISQRTFEKSYDEAYNNLKMKYPSHESLRREKISKIAILLESSGLGKQKARAINEILNKIYSDFGKTSLDKLKDMNDENRFNYLMTLPRVGIKTAYCVMMYCYNSKVLPIDTNVRRLGHRISFLNGQKDSIKEHKIIHTLIPPDQRYNFHVNAVVHGRKICIPEHPRCNLCSLYTLCDYFTMKNTGTEIERN